MGDAGGDASNIQKAELERLLRVEVVKKNEFEKVHTKMKEEQSKQENNNKQKTLERRMFKERLDAPKSLKADLERSKEVLQTLVRDLAKDEEVGKRQLLEGYKKCVGDLVTSVEKIAEHCRICVDLQVEVAVAEDARHQLYEDIAAATQALQDARSSLNKLKLDVKSAEVAKQEAERFFAKANEKLKAERERFTSADAFAKWFKDEVLTQCPEDSVDAINDRIAAIKVLLDSAIDNPQIAERYESTKAETDRLVVEVKSLENAFQQIDDNVKSRSKSWLDQVLGVSDKLNSKFSSYMQDLQYQGDVALRQTATFDKYQMQMRVSFRENDKLIDLSGERHSGGERAVSTIMYLMALQDLTNAPFRVVDEINQVSFLTFFNITC